MMNKTELISKIAKKTGLTKRQATTFTNGMLECITESLQSGEQVRITGLCTFELKQYAARCGRDLKRNTSIRIPVRKLPVCRMSESFRERFR